MLRLVAPFLVWLCLCASASAARYPLDFLPPPDEDDGLTFRVLCLHDVRDDLRASFKDFPDPFAIDTRTLVDLFDWLRDTGYNPVSTEQIVAARSGGERLPPKPVLLTFDDGFVSGYTKVLPLLERFNYPAVFAIVTKWVDTPEGSRIRLSPKIEVDRDTFLNWDQVKALAASPLVEIASHTHDLHRGVLANPQGNELPAAAARRFDPATGEYESDEAYRARIRADLEESRRLIELHTGRAPRTIAWPYGAQNRDADAVATELGFDVMLTLQPGPNTPDVPLTQVRRGLIDYELNVGSMSAALRQPMTYQGRLQDVQRVVQVDLDYVYDPDPAQQERNLSALIDRIKDLAPSAVYLQAFTDYEGSGDVTSVYFPNRHMPMRADIFNRVAWQLKTRANVPVYAWMPVLTFTLPEGHPVRERVVQSADRAPGERGRGHPSRLSPFDPEVRRVIDEIYEDLAKAAQFDGILFHDDAVLDAGEDASPAALQTYASWGLPPDIAAIRASPELSERWARAKTRYLIDFTHELTATVEGYQNGHDMLTARNLFAAPVLDPAAEADYAQSLRAFLDNYDYVALMAMPRMEEASDGNAWLRGLVERVREVGGLRNTIFELQSVDWRDGSQVPSRELREQMTLLRRLGAIHYGYYPDDFVAGHPDVEVLRETMSLKSSLEPRRAPARQAAVAPASRQAKP